MKQILSKASPVAVTPMKYTANETMNRLINDLRGMTEGQLTSLTQGVAGIKSFLDGEGFLDFKGKMEVKAGVKDLPMGMNLMRWLTKFYFPDTVKGFDLLYRLHATTDAKIVVGKKYKFTPRKPILSWTDLRVPYVADRDTPTKKIIDCVITSTPKPQDIIWSYKIIKYKPLLQKAASDYSKAINGKGPKRDDSNLATLIETFLQQLYKAVQYMLAKEQEVVVFNNMKPFSAMVLSKG